MNDQHNSPADEVALDENHIIAERREKLAQIRKQGIAFPNDFQPSHLAPAIQRAYQRRVGGKKYPCQNCWPHVTQARHG